jgi:hypothetical protein
MLSMPLALIPNSMIPIRKPRTKMLSLKRQHQQKTRDSSGNFQKQTTMELMR